MQPFLLVLLALFALAALYALVNGLVTMARGKDMTGVRSNTWMFRRVVFQGLAIVVVMIMFLFTRHGA